MKSTLFLPDKIVDQLQLHRIREWKRPNWKWRLLIGISLILLLVVIIRLLHSKSGASGRSAGQPTISVASAVVQRGDMLKRIAYYPAVNFGHQAIAFSRRNKCHGWNQRTFFIDQPQ